MITLRLEGIDAVAETVRAALESAVQAMELPKPKRPAAARRRLPRLRP